MLAVRALMTPNPDTVEPSDSLRTVLGKMNVDGCRHLPVMEGERLAGIITDRDVRLAVSSPLLGDETVADRQEALDSIEVRDCMSGEPVTVQAESAARDAAELLRLNGFGALPVLDGDNLVGILTVTDFLRHFAEQS